MKKILILFLFALQFLSARAESYFCKQIGIDNGLSLSAVTDISYDGRGALWIGTRFGLNEYRNAKIRTFYDDGSGRILGNYINMIHPDSNGDLWVSTDKGLFVYDLSSDAFNLVSDNPVTCALDMEGGIWFGSHFGLEYYKFEDRSLTGGGEDAYTDYLALYDYDGGLLSLDKRTGLVLDSLAIDLPELEGSLIMASALDGDILYLSLLGRGLIAYDLKARRTVLTLRSGEDGFPSEPLLALMMHEGQLWMGFDGASVRIFDAEDRSARALQQHPGRSGDRIPPSVTKLYSDPLGNVWVGSVRSGVVGLKRSPIQAFDLKASDPDAENVIISVFPSVDGSIYLGTDGSGVGRYTSSEGITLFPAQQGLKVTSIADFGRDSLIIATYNRGFFLMDRDSSALRPFILVDDKTNREECFHSNSPALFNLDDGRLLLLAVHTFVYEPDSARFSVFADEANGLSAELIPIGPQTGGLLYAYSGQGLFLIDLDHCSIRSVYIPSADEGSINTAVYHGGLIWFGTNYGLFSLDTRTGQSQKVDSGLFSRVSRLQSNGSDNLWIGADNMLFLDRNGRIEMTGENRGVPANEFLSSACAPDGTVYLGGTDGLVEIGADCYFDLSENKEILLRDSSYSSVELPYNYSSLVITVSLAGSDPFERNLYRYNVRGTSEITAETFEDSMSLPALKPGRYWLDVSYLRSDGVWSEPQEVSAIHVKQPWYFSVPMVIVYVLLVIVLVAVAIDAVSRRRVRRIEAKLRAADSEFTGKLEGYIAEHLGDPSLDVAMVADYMAMSRATLYYKMNAAYGKGVAEVIEAKRMAKAEELLRSGSMSVLDISEAVGYSTSRYFSTRFKLLHDGQTPLKYRQSHG